MAIVKMAQVYKRFTEVVANLMAMDDLTFDLEAMNGHQGEEGKVALTDGEFVYMVYVNRARAEVTGIDDRFTRSADVLKLKVGKYQKQTGTWNTYWLNKEDEVLLEEIWYELPGYSRDVYTTSADEYIEIFNKWYQRSKARWSDESRVMKIGRADHLGKILDIIKAHTGRKRVNLENLVSVTKDGEQNKFWITCVFNGRRDTICVR